MSMPRGFMVFVNAFTAWGAFTWDWSETHVFNPRWPPHAKFHNGQTMSLSIALTLLNSYLLFRPCSSFEQTKDSAWVAALVGTLYGLTGLSAILYPGADWMDPEFGPHGKGAQAIVFSGVVVMNWIGYALEMRRLRQSSRPKKT